MANLPIWNASDYFLFGLRAALAAPDRWNSPVKSLYAGAAWPSSCGATCVVRLELPDQDARARPVTLPRSYSRPMIDLGTLGGLHEHQHELAAYCPCCDRWRVLPLPEMVSQGKGSLCLPMRVTCRVCGEVGQLQVRPPMPSRRKCRPVSIRIMPGACLGASRASPRVCVANTSKVLGLTPPPSAAYNRACITSRTVSRANPPD